MKVVKLSDLRTGRLYPPGDTPWYSFLLEAESIPRSYCGPEGLNQLKIPMTQLGIEHATFWLVAQCLRYVHD